MTDVPRTRVGEPLGGVPAGQYAGRTACIVWSSRSQAIAGGLQRQIDRLVAEADALQLNVSVISPPDDGLGPGPENRLGVAQFRTSLEAIGALLGKAAILYCARLYKGLERAQLPALLRIAEQVPVVIRCPTTDDARRLRTAALAGAIADPLRQQVIAHCLNRRSAELLRGLRDHGLRPVVHYNTAQPRPRVNGAEASPPVAPSVFYCGRADRSKNLEGLLAAWPLVPTDRDLNLFGPGQLQRLASRQQRVVYGGCYQGDPPFRLGDVVVLPSFREGHTNVLVEAFRAGAVVVGSAVPGIEEHLADHRGILIGRPCNARSIAVALASAVTLPAGQRARLGLRAQAYFDESLASPYSSAIHVMRVALQGLVATGDSLERVS
ncbi:MAG TPA: glycosyltransferase family 4 protein [Actinomycetes bacterium]|jgi:glycosyltransferase involved in cell wall biosynthesis|nr:glycosyltransferase family 4 protein [Actinomycetes bacterium]